jgi:hypothetical protein
MPNTVGQSIETWLRNRHWNPILTFLSFVFTIIGIGFVVGYGMTYKHVYMASLLFFIAFVLFAGGAWHGWKASHRLKWTATVVATAAFGLGDCFWIKSMNQPVPWLLLYINSHFPWALIFVLATLLLATFIRRPKEITVSATFPTQKKSTTEEKPNKPTLPLALPELRPKIVAVGYCYLISVQALGLDTANDGEPAYDISIPDVKLGTSVVTFGGKCPRMENRSSTEWRVLIKHDTGGFSTGNSLREEMQRQGIGEITVPIRYRDGNGLWYVSHCRIELKASARGGIAVHNDIQELVSGKPTQGSAAFPPTAPRPYLEVEDPIDERFGKTLFHFTNRGGDVAHNIQVQPLTINHLSVVFDPIPLLAVDETKTTIPTIPGIGINGGHDILNQMEKEWEGTPPQHKFAQEGKTEERSTEVTVTYEDFNGRRFEANLDLVVFPINRTLRNKHALELPQRNYKTVEVRKIKFKEVG